MYLCIHEASQVYRQRWLTSSCCLVLHSCMWYKRYSCKGACNISIRDFLQPPQMFILRAFEFWQKAHRLAYVADFRQLYERAGAPNIGVVLNFDSDGPKPPICGWFSVILPTGQSTCGSCVTIRTTWSRASWFPSAHHLDLPQMKIGWKMSASTWLWLHCGFPTTLVAVAFWLYHALFHKLPHWRARLIFWSLLPQ